MPSGRRPVHPLGVQLSSHHAMGLYLWVSHIARGRMGSSHPWALGSGARSHACPAPPFPPVAKAGPGCLVGQRVRDPVCLRERLGFTSSVLARSWGAPASVGRGSPVTQCFLVPAEAIVWNSSWDRTPTRDPGTHTCETVSCWSVGHTSVALSLSGG